MYKGHTLFAVLLLSATAGGQIIVPSGLEALTLAGPAPGHVVRLEADRLGSYGGGALGATVQQGALRVYRYTDNGATVLAQRAGFDEAAVATDVRMGTHGPFEGLLWVAVHTPAAGGPSFTDLIKVSGSGNSAIVDTAGDVALRMALTVGQGVFTPGGYFFNGDAAAGTDLLYSDGGGFQSLGGNVLPPGRTDLDVVGMEFDPIGVHGNWLVVVDSDDNDHASAVYGMKSNLTWFEITEPVSYNQRRFRDMAFSTAGLFGQRLYVTERLSDTVQFVHPSGAVATFAEGFANVESITVDKDGNNMYVSDDNGVYVIREATPGPSAMVRCAAVSSGADQHPAGGLVNLGQPLVGVSGSAGIAMAAGVVPCMVVPDVAPPMTAGDCDGDGDVDLFDYGCFADCVTGPGGGVPADCEAFDFDDDDDVDLIDWSSFQGAFAP